MKQQILIGLLTVVLLSGCALLDAVQPTADVIATVNGVSLTRADLNKRIALVQVATWLSTGGSLNELDESKAIDQWIDSELVAQAAAKASVSVGVKDAEQEIARLLGAANLNEIDLLRQLNVAGVAREDFVRYQQRALAVQRFTQTSILADASEAERPARLATWLVRERGSAKIEKPTPPTGPKQVGSYAGSIAADFRLPNLDGVETTLESQRGKLVMLNFWATWCGPCRSEMPALQKTYESLKDQGLVLLGINVGETREQVKAYAAELHLSFPLLLDSDSKTARSYRVYGLPTTVFVDRKGVILEVAVGALDERTLDSRLKRMLNDY